MGYGNACRRPLLTSEFKGFPDIVRPISFSTIKEVGEGEEPKYCRTLTFVPEVMRNLPTSTRCRLFAFDLFHKPFQSRHQTRLTTVVVFIKFKHLQKLLRYTLGG